MDYLHRKHLEEFKNFCNAKNEEVNLYKNKYMELNKKYKELKEMQKREENSYDTLKKAVFKDNGYHLKG